MKTPPMIPGKLYVVVSKFLDSDPLEQPMIGEAIFVLEVKRSVVFKWWYTIRFLSGETINTKIRRTLSFLVGEEVFDVVLDSTRCWKELNKAEYL